MKLKNLFKTFALFALVLPCALIFTACGNNHVSVNTKGNYVTTTKENVETFMETAETTIFKGYKMYSYSSQEVMGQKINTTIEGVYTVDEQNNVQAKMDINMKAGKQSAKMAYYLVDKNMYFDGEGQKIKINLTEEYLDSAQYTQYLQYFLNYDEIDRLMSVDGAEFKVASEKDSTTKKFEVKLNNEDQGITTFIYLVFEENVLTGVKMVYEIDKANKMTIDIVAYEGEAIELPSFEGYTDFSQMLPEYPTV